MEGRPPRYNFTAQQWYYIRTLQKLVLLMPISDFARDLWITKQFRRPVEAMRERVRQITRGDTSRDTLRYIMYSAHDVQVANVLQWL
jgi:hypothetical protein